MRSRVLALACTLAALVVLPGQVLVAASTAFTALLLVRHARERCRGEAAPA